MFLILMHPCFEIVTVLYCVHVGALAYEVLRSIQSCWFHILLIHVDRFDVNISLLLYTCNEVVEVIAPSIIFHCYCPIFQAKRSESETALCKFVSSWHLSEIGRCQAWYVSIRVVSQCTTHCAKWGAIKDADRFTNAVRFAAAESITYYYR